MEFEPLAFVVQSGTIQGQRRTDMDLANCRKCKGMAGLHAYTDGHYVVHCLGCGFEPTINFDNPDNAKRAWNNANERSTRNIEALLQAIAVEPRPLLLTLTLQEHASFQEAEEICNRLYKFQQDNKLPPIFVCAHGQKLEAVLDPRTPAMAPMSQQASESLDAYLAKHKKQSDERAEFFQSSVHDAIDKALYPPGTFERQLAIDRDREGMLDTEETRQPCTDVRITTPDGMPAYRENFLPRTYADRLEFFFTPHEGLMLGEGCRLSVSFDRAGKRFTFQGKVTRWMGKGLVRCVSEGPIGQQLIVAFNRKFTSTAEQKAELERFKQEGKKSECLNPMPMAFDPVIARNFQNDAKALREYLGLPEPQAEQLIPSGRCSRCELPFTDDAPTGVNGLCSCCHLESAK